MCHLSGTMQKIASPNELQAELKAIIAFIQGYGPEGKPDRRVIEAKLRELADRVSATAGDFTEEEWKTHKQEHPKADPGDHTITKGDKGRDVSKEKGFESLKGLDPAKQRALIKKVLLNMEAEKDEEKGGPTKQRDVSKEKGFEVLKGLSPAAQRKVIERALKKAAEGNWA